MRSKGSTNDTRKNARGVCSIEGCGRPHQAKGLCNNHFNSRRAKEVRREAMAARPPRVCGFCGGEVDPSRRRHGPVSYCSRACKDKAQIASGAAAAACLKYYYKQKYGLTMDEVATMRARGCAICGTVEWMGRHSQAHIDHDHVTGVVRGVLCHECNTGLGKFRDDPDLLRRAADYLTPR